MAPWRSQIFRQGATQAGVPPDVIDNTVEAVRVLQTITPGAQPIFSLRHLAHLTDIDYAKLRSLVTRRYQEPYAIFRIQKRPIPGEPTRFRTIVVPSPWLMALQRWINANILSHVNPHEASFAFSEGCSIRDAAVLHCECQWLVKIDIRNFFESITEAQVYRVFESIGYQPLIAFELARLCTRVGDRQTRTHHRRFKAPMRDYKISDYRSGVLGHLPQGAPSSPHIANIAARSLDTVISEISAKHGLIYTRYADDLIFSKKEKEWSRSCVRNFVGEIYGAISDNGFTPNSAKTVVAPPGARKVVLGLLVDREKPHLTREFKATIRKHLHFLLLNDQGPTEHARRNGGATTYGIRRHVLGLIQHARQIDPPYGNARLAEFNKIKW